MTAAQISRELHAPHDFNQSHKIASRRLKKIGRFARLPEKKPLISNKNKKFRSSLAQKYEL